MPERRDQRVGRRALTQAPKRIERRHLDMVVLVLHGLDQQLNGRLLAERGDGLDRRHPHVRIRIL
jgi:hypothetical protein